MSGCIARHSCRAWIEAKLCALAVNAQLSDLEPRPPAARNHRKRPAIARPSKGSPRILTEQFRARPPERWQQVRSRNLMQNINNKVHNPVPTPERTLIGKTKLSIRKTSERIGEEEKEGRKTPAQTGRRHPARRNSRSSATSACW